MRYRPFAREGMAVSALSLALDGAEAEHSATEWRDLMHAAFEEGVNAFELLRPNSELLEGFADGASAVRRNLLFVALRIGDSADAANMVDWVGKVMEEAGLSYVDLLSLEADASRPAGAPAVMRALRDHGLARRLAIAGEAELLADHMKTGAFDAVITPFNILSGWRERHMIRLAVERQMTVIGCEPHPAAVAPLTEAASQQGKGGWFTRPNPLATAGSYAFLERTPGWSAEQICFGCALTEPAVATVITGVREVEHLAMLSQITERDLPAAVSAQIEMARFSAERAAGVERRSTIRRSA
jgi:aryl-alcohol dehydrogenase-like predicted oxidoreductase